MKLIADESVDFEIIKSLRNNNYDIISVNESYRGSDDEDILALALKEEAVLLTEDKDFGELVFRLNKAHLGIILIRLSGIESHLKSQTVLKSLTDNFDKMRNSFSVISYNQTRIKNK